MIKTAQPYGAFAKTMLEKQVYPDLRIFPGGPPEPPYDVTGHTLWMLMGVTVDQVDKAFETPLERVTAVKPITAAAPARPKAAYLVGPESYGVFKLVAALQKAVGAGVPCRRGLRGARGRHVHHSVDRGLAADRGEGGRRSRARGDRGRSHAVGRAASG